MDARVEPGHEGKIETYPMPSILLTPPAAEPLPRADAKRFLRIEHDTDDELIEALIASARREVELATRRMLVTQRWRIVFDRWPRSGRIRSPVNPLVRIDAARVYDENDVSEAVDTAVFALDTASVPARIDCSRLNIPAPRRRFAGIELDVTAGYGTADDVPAPLVQAIRLLVARSYESRDRVIPDALPHAVATLIAPFRVLSL
jgi:uncharacterized phiE125 gp8 family phage protein